MNKGKSSTLLLINPWIYDFAAYDFWAQPLGFFYLAALLRRNGYTLQYVDCLNSDHPALMSITGFKSMPRRKDGKGKFFKAKIEKPNSLTTIPRNYNRYGIPPEFFFAELEKTAPPAAILVTSAMTYWYPGVFDVIRIAKKIFPRTPVILGGSYATLCYFHAKRFSGADFIVTGPGEMPGLQLVSSLTGKTLSFLPDKKNLDSLPYPAFDLLRTLHYVCISTSRGCPYRCHYCASRILNPSYRSRKPVAVADEIEFWSKEYGVSNVAFYDDALLYRPENHFILLLQELIRRRIHCHFHTPNGIHIRGVTEEIAHLMFESGFKTIRFGLETADENQMAKIGEKTTRKEFIEAVHCLKKAGFSEDEIGVYLLAGLPGQKAIEVEESIRFVKDAGARPYLAEYSPIPGTLLWEQAVNVSQYDLVNEPLFHNNTILPCEWENFTRADLDRLKQMLK